MGERTSSLFIHFARGGRANLAAVSERVCNGNTTTTHLAMHMHTHTFPYTARARARACGTRTCTKRPREAPHVCPQSHKHMRECMPACVCVYLFQKYLSSTFITRLRRCCSSERRMRVCLCVCVCVQQAHPPVRRLHASCSSRRLCVWRQYALGCNRK